MLGCVLRLARRTPACPKHWRRYSANPDVDQNLVTFLDSRGLLSQTTGPGLKNQVTNPSKVYLGADPSAESLHLGNLIPLMVLIHFYIRGHTVYPLVGGATGMVGDPSGRLTERQQMEAAKREANVTKIHNQMQTILRNAGLLSKSYGYAANGSVVPVNNYTWWKDVSMLGFLSTYGRHIRVSAMLGRESVKQRLASEQGIGFNEFTYQVLQAFDFYELYRTHDCTIQIGGNDQWGNITAGIDLISRLKRASQADAHGLTVPLLTTPSGEKFGKSAGNAIFLDEQLTRPYHLYQYFINAPDSVVRRYLEMFTLIPSEEIEHIVRNHEQDPEKRSGQHRVAFEVSKLIHGEEKAANSRLVSMILFENYGASSKQVLDSFESENMVTELPANNLFGRYWSDLLAQLTGKSKSEAARMIKQGGVYTGLARNPLTTKTVSHDHLDDDLLLVRIGKTGYYPIRVK